MSNFHCIQEGCAEVRYQSYKLINKIKYQYPGEEPQTILGDDYSINRPLGQCIARYVIQIEATAYYRRLNNSGEIYSSSFSPGKILQLLTPTFSSRLLPDNEAIQSDESYRTSGNVVAYSQLKYCYLTNLGTPYCGLFGGNLRGTSNNGDRYAGLILGSGKVISVRRLDGQPDNCGDCEFRVFLDGETVFQESRSSCPQVEILESVCRLSDRTEVIQIEKTPFLERVEVSNSHFEINRSQFLDKKLKKESS